MNSLSSAPFIRILPAFCIGIVCSFYNAVNYSFALFIFLTGILGILIFFSKHKPNYSYRCYTGISLQFIFFILGFGLTEIKDERHSIKHFSNIENSNYFIARIEDSPKGHNGKLRVSATLLSVFKNNIISSVKGKSYFYFKNDSNANFLESGDQIIFKGLPSLIQPPLNPGQFDFKYRSSIHRIYHQINLSKNQWIKLPIEKKTDLKSIAVKLRNTFLSSYKKAGLQGQEYAVLSALVLGYDDEIDNETMKAFSASGTLHVLSVSGMHVGIIFTALSAMLVFLNRNKYTRLLRLFILLGALWFYALLTGLSPSVIRSAMMFSFILIGKSLNRSSNIYNSLALSALFIFILFDPLMLLEVGLQLSFLAVAGIAFLYPQIYQILFIKNLLLEKVWKLIAVSIAAQAATFALSIYYFHQFPNYFIPANLIIIPISTIAIFAGILLLLINPFPSICIKAGVIIKQLIYFLNASAVFIQDLPGSVWEGVSISMINLLNIYIILFALVYFFETKSIKMMYLFLISCCTLLFSFAFQNYIRFKEKDLIVFSNTFSLSFQLNNGFNTFLFYHSSDSIQAFRNSSNYCISKGLNLADRKFINLDSIPENETINNVFFLGKYILIENYLILDLTKQIKSDFITEKVLVNLTYVNKYTFKYLLNKKINTEELVIRNTNDIDFTKSEFKNISSKIYSLSNGSRIIKL